MELVEATPDDFDALIDRWYDLARGMEAYSELNELAYADVRDVPDDGFRAHLQNDEITDYRIVHEEETIGLLTLRVGRHPSRQYSRYLRIVNLVIDEDERNQGHGAAVVEQVKSLALERGCDHLKVSCEWQNEGARRFYRGMNFQPKQVDYVQPLE
ncbi:GNAT family N-acetyltransferase [Halobacteria archaeon AArc-curdl1]|uniref:GNAT family N-acetyltransferase n=1 Tax=Natronosalvus hydrolyticus TaxID=2979988 RepID=A0AAP2Z8E2_9EURY|nr:GNAT family N-acetyltransferase [Halobacteria archaeon AArc-curdl1]